MSIEIHVLGAGKGESIVIGWPGGGWGVVDCYAPSLSDHKLNPTLQFLLARGVTELEFLCLTHPHDDHYRGMSHLLQHLKVKYFWRFPTLGARDLQYLAKFLAFEAEQTGVADQQENANEFVEIMKLVTQKRKSKQLTEKPVNGHQYLYPIPYDQNALFQVWSFAPHGNQVSEYQQLLASSFTKDSRFKPNPPHVSHNEISVGLMIIFGKTRVVLGGDCEKSAWTDVCSDFDKDYFCVNAVKVPHHGSETGYTPELWGKLSASRKPIAMIAPYRRFKLPKPEALNHIGNHASKILLTCQTDCKTPPIPVKHPLQSRLFIRTKLKARTVETENECGRCSLTFDSEGNCLTCEMTGPAYTHE